MALGKDANLNHFLSEKQGKPSIGKNFQLSKTKLISNIYPVQKGSTSRFEKERRILHGKIAELEGKIEGLESELSRIKRANPKIIKISPAKESRLAVDKAFLLKRYLWNSHLI